MKFRNTLLMLLVTAAAGAYVYFYEIKGGEEREKDKAAAGKLADIKKDSVSAITVNPDGIALKKIGTTWELVAPVKYQADDGTVNSLLSAVESAQRDRQDLTKSSSDHAGFGLAPARTELIVRHEKGEADTLYLGDTNATATFVYARVNSDPEVVLTNNNLVTNAQKSLFDWRNKDLLIFDNNAANRLVLKTPKEKFELKKENGKWQMQSPMKAAADESKISSILSRVRYGRINEFATEQMDDAKTYGLDKPAYEFTVYFGANDVQKSLNFGKKDGANYFAFDPARSQVFKVDTSLVKDLNVSAMDLRNKKIAEFESWNADWIELNYADTLKIVCEKDTASNWQITAPEKKKAKSWEVSNITGAITGLEAAAFADENAADLKTYGLDKPRLTVTVKQQGNEIGKILIGKEKGDRVYAKAANHAVVIEAKKEEVDKLFKKVSDLAE